MASSSSYSHPAPVSSSSSQSCNWNVFLSFRGEDTRKTFVDHLYSALVDRKISTYKDDETLPRGESIRPSLFKAIKGSQIAVIVFSQNYADSSWCLEELAYIMKCKDKRGLTVMPVFYDVDPSEVRKQKRKFGEAFAKHEVENISRAQSWRDALIHASEIAGWEPKNIANGHESKVIKEIVDTISGKLFSVNSYVDETLVGMSTRLQELETQLDIGSHGVRMIGVWGVGVGGKTTLASSIYIKISRHFQGHCIIENIREESSKHGLTTLQEKFLSRLLKRKMELHSVEEGKHMIRSRLNRSNVLILLDDVDDCKQLDALVGSHNWFGSGSRIIITTRDEHLLRTHRVDHVCPVTLLSNEEATMLFNKHAYNIKSPISNYEKHSFSVISYSNGLPLALKVLGSFLYDKDEKEWISSLDRLKDIPEMEILEKLKISYDGLKNVEKELFLDIACFFRGKSTKEPIFEGDDAIEVFEACGYHPDIGIKVLTQKALITIVDGRFDMHDLIQEMGHYIVRGEYPKNPEKHNRVWKYEEIKNMCLGDATMENNKLEAIQLLYSLDDGYLSPLCKIVSNMKKLRWLILSQYLSAYEDGDGDGDRDGDGDKEEDKDKDEDEDEDEDAKGPTFLSNELQYIKWRSYPGSLFPDSFQAKKLAFLKLDYSSQKQLWKGYKHLPQLKVLKLYAMMNLLSTPNFDGLPSLQKLTLFSCEQLQEIHPSLGKHTSLEYVSVESCRTLRMFPTIVHLRKLKTLVIKYCHNILEFPEIKSIMESLVKLFVTTMKIDVLLSLIGYQCPNLISLDLFYCSYLKNNEVKFYGLKHLEDVRLKQPDRVRSQFSKFWHRSTHSLRKLDMFGCYLKDGEIPPDIGELSNLQELNLSGSNFTRLDFSLLQLTRLKLLNLSNCKWLVELPKLPSGVAALIVNFCESLTTYGDFYTNYKWLCQVSLLGGGVVTDGSRLLQSMLEGNAIKNHSMIMRLEGLEIAKGFRPRLVRGNKCRLKLPDNWSSDFSGFLMCATGTERRPSFTEEIRMEQVLSGMNYEDDVVWEESDDEISVVRYVSFASFRHTVWWDSTYKEVLFSLRVGYLVSGFGVGLVAMNKESGSGSGSGSGATETSTAEEESKFANYIPTFMVQHDSINALEFYLSSRQDIEHNFVYS